MSGRESDTKTNASRRVAAPVDRERAGRAGRRLRVGRGGPARIVAVALALGLLAGASAAAGAEEEPFAYDLAGELMSPFCPGRTLASCPSPQAAELVQKMVLQEAAGATREEVVEMLVAEYGEEILGAPPARGITLWAYVFPVAGFLLGGAVAFVVLRRIVAAPARPSAASPAAAGAAVPEAAPPPGAASAGPDEDELARIVDAELARRA